MLPYNQNFSRNAEEINKSCLSFVQPFVMSSAVCMAGSATMAYVSSGARTTQDTHAKTPLHWWTASLYVGTCWLRKHLGNIVPRASPAYSNNLRRPLSCPTITVWCQVEGPYSVLLTMVTVQRLQSGWPAGYASFELFTHYYFWKIRWRNKRNTNNNKRYPREPDVIYVSLVYKTFPPKDAWNR